jgi:hypothetical protein
LERFIALRRILAGLRIVDQRDSTQRRLSLMVSARHGLSLHFLRLDRAVPRGVREFWTAGYGWGAFGWVPIVSLHWIEPF